MAASSIDHRPSHGPRSFSIASTASSSHTATSASASTTSSTSILRQTYNLLPLSGHRSPPLLPISPNRPSPWCLSFPRVYSHLYTILWDRGLHKRTRTSLFEVRGSGIIVLAVLMYEQDIETWPELEARFLAHCRQYWHSREPPVRFWWVEEHASDRSGSGNGGGLPVPPTEESCLALGAGEASLSSASSSSFASCQSHPQRSDDEKKGCTTTTTANTSSCSSSRSSLKSVDRDNQKGKNKPRVRKNVSFTEDLLIAGAGAKAGSERSVQRTDTKRESSGSISRFTETGLFVDGENKRVESGRQTPDEQRDVMPTIRMVGSCGEAVEGAGIAL